MVLNRFCNIVTVKDRFKCSRDLSLFITVTLVKIGAQRGAESNRRRIISQEKIKDYREVHLLNYFPISCHLVVVNPANLVSWLACLK